jgi:hypothetical protein
LVGSGTVDSSVTGDSALVGRSASAGLLSGNTREAECDGAFSSDMVGTSDSIPVGACDAALPSSARAVMGVVGFSLGLA